MIAFRGLILRLIFVLLFPVFAAAQGAAPAPSPANDGGITRQQADEILQELRQIHQLLASQAAGQARTAQAGTAAAPANAQFSVAGLPVLGRADAPLTLIEFSDYQCPFCRAFHTGTFPELKKNWIDTGKLRFVSTDLPLEFHSNAAGAAQAVRCAGEQNKFWELRSLLIANADNLAPARVLMLAQKIPQLDGAKFEACVASGKYNDVVKQAALAGNLQGVTGTPTFLLAKTQGDNVQGALLVGNKSYLEFDKRLSDLLAANGAGQPAAKAP